MICKIHLNLWLQNKGEITMKIIAIFIISVVMVYSQSREAEQKQFEWNLSGTTTTAYLSTIHPSNPQTVKDYFKSDNFILGWHWGGEKIISKVMKVNQSDMTIFPPGNQNDYQEGSRYFLFSIYKLF